MQLLFEEIGSLGNPVAIINSKKRTPWPEANFLECGFNDAQNNRHSVLIVVPDHALVSVGGVRSHHAFFLLANLAG